MPSEVEREGKEHTLLSASASTHSIFQSSGLLWDSLTIRETSLMLVTRMYTSCEPWAKGGLGCPWKGAPYFSRVCYLKLGTLLLASR